jgi:hypothetical protein
LKEKELQCIEAEWKKVERKVLQAQREAAEVQRMADVEVLKAFKLRWTLQATPCAGQDLWDKLNAIKAGVPQPPFYGALPPLCHDNQRY